MKTTNLKFIFVLTLMFALNATVFAQNDIITFTWQADTSTQKSFSVQATAETTFTIAWGNGNYETITGQGNVYINLNYHYKKVGTYNVTLTANSEECRFTALSCSSNRITALNVTGNTALTRLSCYSNQLTTLDLSSNTALEYLDCYNNLLTGLNVNNDMALTFSSCGNNSLPLSTLYAISEILDGNSAEIANRRLGNQIMPTQKVGLGMGIDYSSQNLFNGINTDFILTKAPANDYNVIDGVITFNTTGAYTVVMSNDAIISHTSYPAKVYVEFMAGNVGVRENVLPNISAYPNPTKGLLQVTGYELPIANIQIFDMNGRKQQAEYSVNAETTTIDLSYLPTGIYFLKVADRTVKVVKE